MPNMQSEQGLASQTPDSNRESTAHPLLLREQAPHDLELVDEGCDQGGSFADEPLRNWHTEVLRGGRDLELPEVAHIVLDLEGILTGSGHNT
eukprot:9737346-Alexandrium_andersonii.AAC.1